MKFMVNKATRKPNYRHLEDCADYCIGSDGTVIMRCPIDGTLAYLTKDNPVLSVEPLTIKGPFTFPCLGFHAFVVRNGEIQSSRYIFPGERVPIKGFDLWAEGSEGKMSNE
jgi:hypothetical protein